MNNNISIFIAGDIVPKNKSVELYKNKQDDLLFRDFKDIIKSCDISIANFEAPVIEEALSPIKKTGPCLHTYAYTMETLKQAGFNCITLANNHVRDHGDIGVRATIEAAKKNGIHYVGAGMNIHEARHIEYLTIKNRRIALINACEQEFSIATADNAGANPIDIINLQEDITISKQNADYTIVILHGGIELYSLPTPRMKRLFRHLIDLGADAVINHHQHCFSGYELYKNKPIFYGLGNFNFYSTKNKNNTTKWHYGFAVVLNIGNNTFELLPYEQCIKTASTNIITEQNKFIKEINELNNIISNDILLEKEFCKLSQERKSFYLSQFEPYNNFLLKFFKRKLLPSTFKMGKKLIVLNFCRCESHNDLLRKILKQEIESNNP